MIKIVKPYWDRLIKWGRKRIYQRYDQEGFVITWIPIKKTDPPENKDIIISVGAAIYLGHFADGKYFGLTAEGWIELNPGYWFAVPPTFTDIPVEVKPFGKLKRFYFRTNALISILIFMALIICILIITIIRYLWIGYFF